MALTLDSVTPDYVGIDGGDRLDLTGTFDLGTAYTVTLGGVACYSGVAGQSSVCYSYDGASLRCYAPTQGSVATVALAVTDPSGATQSIANAVRVRMPFYASEVFSLRSVLPPDYNVGARNMAQLDAVVAQ